MFLVMKLIIGFFIILILMILISQALKLILILKKATVLDLKINSKGLVNVDCSVSNEPFDYELNSKLDLIVKFGEFYDDSNDELMCFLMVHIR